MPTVSVVVPAYNYAHYLGGAIDSVLHQNTPPEELVIVDDGSTDDTESIVSRYVADSRIAIQYIKTKNAGVASARNLGIRKACGEYVLLLDADDRLLPESIEILLNQVKLNPALDLVVGGCFARDESGRRKYRPAPKLKARQADNFKDYLRNRVSLSHGRFIARRTVFEKIKYPVDFRCSEDISVFAQLLVTCKGIGINEPVAEIFHHADSLRNKSKLSTDVGLKVVEAVFNPALIPAELFTFRSGFLVRRCLSMFRTLYRAGDYEQARKYYSRAVEESVFAALRWSYLSKYIRMQGKCLLRRFGMFLY